MSVCADLFLVPEPQPFAIICIIMEPESEPADAWLSSFLEWAVKNKDEVDLEGYGRALAARCRLGWTAWRTFCVDTCAPHWRHLETNCDLPRSTMIVPGGTCYLF